jgi:hypothetical protein
MRRFFFIYFGLLIAVVGKGQQKDIRIVFTSDLHFGLKKARFRNSPDSVTSEQVNQAMAASIRTLGKINYIIVTGDIANREEIPLQSASVSWKQFMSVFGSLHIPLLLVPGNHDVSNAIGHYKAMAPEKDASALVGIYNLMKHPRHLLDTAHFKYTPVEFDYSRNIGGIHFIFINMWPDSANRAWMEKDLAKVSSHTPVLIFAHDPPEGDPMHFTDPSGKKMNAKDKFEYLLSQVYNADFERGWDLFIKKHGNIKGYFHGHSNYQEFYTYKGKDGDLSLPCDRVDSPMKGKFSSKDEKLLSFQEIIVHPVKRQIEIKECLWNTGEKIKWGVSHIMQF